MSNLQHAFEIPVNPENKDFVRFPYIPYQRVMDRSDHKELIDPRLLVLPRCFDIKHGALNCYAPSYAYAFKCNQGICLK
jgi:hypothetical protein